eukprot:8106647-Karenia_brevis.AAC.1
MNALGKPISTVAVRGLSKAWAENDFRERPLDQNTVCELLTVRLVRGHEALIDQFGQLRVRSQEVKQMANIYIENHYEDLVKKCHQAVGYKGWRFET